MNGSQKIYAMQLMAGDSALIAGQWQVIRGVELRKPKRRLVDVELSNGDKILLDAFTKVDVI